MTRVFLIFLFVSSACFGQTDQKITVEQLKEDINLLKKKIQTLHPNLYLYSSKDIIDNCFDSLYLTVKESLTELVFYRHITIISSIIKDGHSIILPSSNTTSFHNENSLFFPFKLKLISGSLFVEMVLTDSTTISEGSEILSINGIGTNKMLKELMERQVRDGYNETYPAWIIDNYFREFYSYIFGHPDEFRIEYKSNDIRRSTIVKALKKDRINANKIIRYPLKINVRKPKEGILFTENLQGNVATLTIKDFHKEVLEDEYKQDFRKEIKRAFGQLHQTGIQNLILDLRNNQGGDVEYGVYLLSFLLQEDFTYIDQYSKVAAGPDFQLIKTRGEATGVHHPAASTFKGQLYVLINGGSFSNSGIVSTILKKYNRAIFIGTETGGNNKVLAGDVTEYNLPNTKIHFEIPTRRYMLRESLPLTGHGTIPDYEIPDNINDVLANKDTQMDFALKIIREKSSGK